MSRDELLKLFSLYAVPKARRNNSNADVEMTPARTNVNIVQRENGNKRSRHQMITAPTVETVTNACKKIRLFSTAANTQKRPCQPSPMVRVSDTEKKYSVKFIIYHVCRFRKVILTYKHRIQPKRNERKLHGPKPEILYKLN